jgi:hypothetical protein
MSTFAKLRAGFDTNWTTILAGWNGLGPFSPWPERCDEFPPWISRGDVSDYANERLAASSDPAEIDLIGQLLSLDLGTEGRNTIRRVLMRLSALAGGAPALELRKWRLILLTELLDNLPNDALYGAMALNDFWQNFDQPSDKPDDIQRKRDADSPVETYDDDCLQESLARHRVWIEKESASLQRRNPT